MSEPNPIPMATADTIPGFPAGQIEIVGVVAGTNTKLAPALAALMASAVESGAEAVVGVRLTETVDGYTAYGTAVKKPKSGIEYC